MTLDKMIKEWRSGELVVGDVNNLIQALVSEREEFHTETPLWNQVLNQTEFYNGHGQLVLATITLEEVMLLCDELSENIDVDDINDLFYLRLFKEDNFYSGSVYQSTYQGEKDKLWVSFDKITL